MTTSIAKVKTIKLNVALAGFGCPNKEGKEGKYMYNQYAMNRRTRAKNGETFGVQTVDPTVDNCTFAKSNVYVDKDGNLDRKAKLSGDCIRHNIFGTIMNPAIKEDVTTLVAYIASHEGLVRGYLNPDKNGTTTKRKSPLTVTDAELDNDAVPQIETHSSSGARTDTSFFTKERYGKTHFSFEAFIDLSELSVLSCCDTFDRPCVKEEHQQLFEAQLKKNGIGFKKLALKKKNDHQGEVCYQLDDKSVNELVNILLKKISNIHISNATEFVDFESMTVTFIKEDGTREDVKFTDGKLEKEFSVASQYEETDYDKALEAERLTREAIKGTKEKPAKKTSKKKSDKEEPAETK